MIVLLLFSLYGFWLVAGTGNCFLHCHWSKIGEGPDTAGQMLAVGQCRVHQCASVALVVAVCLHIWYELALVTGFLADVAPYSLLVKQEERQKKTEKTPRANHCSIHDFSSFFSPGPFATFLSSLEETILFTIIVWSLIKKNQ